MKTIETERYTLVNGDCLEYLKTLPDGAVDACITDPPYGINHPCNFKSRKRGALAPCNDYPDVIGDDEPFDPEPLIALNVPTVLWGANNYADKLPPSSGWLVWDKMRPDDIDQSTCELAWTNYVKGVKRLKYLWNGAIRAGSEKLVHPTQKPIALFEWIMSLKWTPKGITVFDPYMGSGPCGCAAVRYGYYVGCELDEHYFDIAAKRIADAAAQPPLFTMDSSAENVEQLGMFE